MSCPRSNTWRRTPPRCRSASSCRLRFERALFAILAVEILEFFDDQPTVGCVDPVFRYRLLSPAQNRIIVVVLGDGCLELLARDAPALHHALVDGTRIKVLPQAAACRSPGLVEKAQQPQKSARG